ncbi:MULTISPECIES: ABC transporter permease [unclassified Crossiella]|uniref:ABC transporter permease n=1 Tax=unclassified Crossiella TaxID=2620835 RepID=UPI001FFE4937|nr:MULTISPECIES: ABC transporter permease [unclassified Crossiella]MCK2243646.1 ABC transporter permease [Crossiella sp. S99.2]MCK2257504.1 ABC transporter permease [Crossiella sp. S99.1]
MTRTAPRLLLSFGLLLAVWQASALLAGQDERFYPTPASVWLAAGELWSHGLLPAFVEVSAQRWLIGVLAGILCAVPLAVLLSLSETAVRMLMPLLDFFHAIVELAWLPLFVLWFGYSTLTIELSIGYVVFFLVLYNTLTGIRQVPPSVVSALRTLGAGRWQVTWEALLPGALPSVLTGVRLGAGFAWRSLVGAEMIAAQSGLGFLIFQSREDMQTSRTVVGMVVIGLLWLLIDRCYLRPVEAATVQRWGVARSAG